MGAKKLERSAAELFLEAALKDGRAARREMSLKAITVDHSLQSRVATDPEHVKHLAGLEDAGVELRPGVVFTNPESGETLLADGFHRHGARVRRRRETMWVYEIEGTRTDAVRYSASANLENSKPTTGADRLKALEMLLADPEFKELPARELGLLCGLNRSTVHRHRDELCRNLGVEPPTHVRCTGKGLAEGSTWMMPLKPEKAKKRTIVFVDSTADPRSPAQRWAARLLKELSPAEIAELIALLQAASHPGQ
jgi:hypothetical protein